MKGIAIILAACLFLINTGNLLESLHDPLDAASMECCSDQGCSCCDEQDHKSSCEDDHACGLSCHCSCGLQLSDLAYAFIEPESIAVQAYHYGNYVNTYTFEYSGDFLQPPRKV